MQLRFGQGSGARGRFEQLVLVHQSSAYNLARWLTGNDSDAEDVTQEALLRAFRYFPGFRGGDARSWLLQIVRNCAYTWLKTNRAKDLLSLDEIVEEPAARDGCPECLLAQTVDHELIAKAVAELPAEFREAIILREMEGLSYKEISQIAEVPIGTVMSRLSRARNRMLQLLSDADEVQ